MDFDIAINTITLTVVDSKVVQLSGFCGLPDKSKMSYEVPYAKKGLLKVLHSEAYIGGVGSYSINKEDWAVSINSKTGWICIGDPQRRGNAVEFINKCISIINERQELVALWLHPCFV